MPIGPNGEKRPPDVITNAVHVMKIATGEIEETYAKPPPSAEQNGEAQPKRPRQEGGKSSRARAGVGNTP